MELVTPPPSLTSAESLAWINARVGADVALTRHRLAKEVCARLDLRDAKGRPREMACRKQLLALHRRGRIELPKPRRQPPARRGPGQPPAQGSPVWPAFTGTLAALGPVGLCPVTGGTQASRDWNAMMRAHHPRRDGPLCGAQIRYLIVSETRGVLGGLAVSAAAWRVRVRDAWLGWTDAERAEKLQGIVCNSRFLILPTIRVRHLASHVLGQLARRLRGDWRDRYGLDPWLMETCVEAPHAGTCYRAANWTELGLTAGRGRQDRDHKVKAAGKRVFVYPLDRARRNRPCPDRANTRANTPAGTPAGWVHREFGGAQLGDARLSRRLLDLGTAFFARPQANIPQACGSTAAAKAAYRFFETTGSPWTPCSSRTTRPPSNACAMNRGAGRAGHHQPLSHHGSGTKGLGPISNKVDGLRHRGALRACLHPAGLPLGILNIEAGRVIRGTRQAKGVHRQPIRTRKAGNG